MHTSVALGGVREEGGCMHGIVLVHMPICRSGWREGGGGGVYAQDACCCKINTTHPTTSFRHLKLFLCIFVVVVDSCGELQNCKPPFQNGKNKQVCGCVVGRTDTIRIKWDLGKNGSTVKVK